MHRPVVRVQDCRILETDGWIKIGGFARFERSRRVLKGRHLPRWDDKNRLTTTPGSLGTKFSDAAATSIKRRIFDASDGLSRQHLAAAIDSLADRVVIFDADDRLLLGNKSWWQEQASFGLTPKIGDRYRDYVSDLADTGCIPGAVGQEEEWVRLRLAQRRQPGEAIEVPLSSGQISRIQDYILPDGGTLTITTTVTGRHQESNAMAASKRSFQNFAEQSVEGIIVHCDSRPLFANQAFADIIGFSSPEDVLNLRSVDDYVAPSELERLASYRERRMRGESAPVSYEFQALHRNGETLWLETRVTVIEWQGAPAIQSMHFDVTDRHDAVLALEASERRSKHFAEAASDWYWETDAEHHFTEVFGGDANDPAYRPLTTLGRTRINEVSARDRQERPEAWRTHLETIAAHQALRDFVYAADMPDGNRYWLRTSGVPVFDEDGQFRGYRGVTANITEDVATKDREHATRKQLATAIDSISEPTTLWDKTGRLTLANQAWFDALEKFGAVAHIGMRYEDHVRSMIEAGVFPEASGYEQAWIEDWIERQRNAGTAYELETRFGTTILIRDHALPDGGIITFTTDITELKRTERIRQQQARSIELLHKVSSAANEATDADRALQVCVDEVCAFTGWPVGYVYRADDDGTSELIPTDIWHLDDGPSFDVFRRVTMSARLAPGEGLPGRVLASGDPEWIEDVTADPTFVRAKQAEDIGVRAAFAFPVLVGHTVVAVLEFFSQHPSAADEPILDIMGQVGIQLGRAIERWRAEHDIRESEARLHGILETGPEAIVSIDGDLHIQHFNGGAESLFGYTADEARGQAIEILLPQRFRSGNQGLIKEVSEAHDGTRAMNAPLHVIGLRKGGAEFPGEAWIPAPDRS